jgi:hypothetical protein
MCPVQSLPLDIVRCVFYEYLIPSLYLDFTRPNCQNEDKLPFGRQELRNFLSCNRTLRSQWRRDLIYFNLSKERTFAFVQDVAFHDRVISLVKDPMRQIGLNFSSLFSWVLSQMK